MTLFGAALAHLDRLGDDLRWRCIDAFDQRADLLAGRRRDEQLGLLGWMGGYIPTAEKILALGVACFFIYVNYRGASETG